METSEPRPVWECRTPQLLWQTSGAPHVLNIVTAGSAHSIPARTENKCPQSARKQVFTAVLLQVIKKVETAQTSTK